MRIFLTREKYYKDGGRGLISHLFGFSSLRNTDNQYNSQHPYTKRIYVTQMVHIPNVKEKVDN